MSFEELSKEEMQEIKKNASKIINLIDKYVDLSNSVCSDEDINRLFVRDIKIDEISDKVINTINYLYEIVSCR